MGRWESKKDWMPNKYVFRKIGLRAQNMLPILEFDNQHEKRGGGGEAI